MELEELRGAIEERLADGVELSDETLDKVVGGLAKLAVGSGGLAHLDARVLADKFGFADKLASTDKLALADALAMPAQFASLADVDDWLAKLSIK